MLNSMASLFLLILLHICSNTWNVIRGCTIYHVHQTSLLVVYPQSSLPPFISALALAGTEGGQMDFLSKRQIAWEDSFRSLYYMLRKNVCNIFYVCTAQFVLMFTGANVMKAKLCAMPIYLSLQEV